MPWGHNFDPIGSSLTWHVYHTGVHLPWKFRVSATIFSNTLSSVYGFAKGSRGGTWHVPRGTCRHVTKAIVLPALWRIFWCLSRLNPTIRSAAIHKSPWTNWQTDWLTNRRRPSCKNPPYPEEISIHQNGLTPILLHYDFELEAICFEPLVSRSLVSFFNTFRVIMFIEAGDVTHRRRGQNRNEEFFFPSFLHRKFFLTQICLFWPNSARNDENKNFRKNKNFDPPNF